MNQSKNRHQVDQIVRHIRGGFELEGKPDRVFSAIEGLDEAVTGSLSWCSPKKENQEELIKRSAASVIICSNSVEEGIAPEKTLIRTDDPRKTFMEVVNGLKKQEIEYGIHPSAVIHPEAEIHEKTWIGPFTYVGKSRVDAGTVIHGHVYIYDNVRIGKDVVIEAGVIIGADGYGYQKNHDGDWERFPHLGGVIIEDKVEISCNATIDRGSLGNTVIGRNTKISKETHISHNVKTGERCIIAGGAMVSGSVTVGNDVWIGPNSTILNKLTVDDRVTISIGAVVTKDVKQGFIAVGNRIIPEKMMKNDRK